MSEKMFTKGQSVKGNGHAANVRYRVLTCHRDGTYTVRALFFIDSDGNDIPGFLGYKYRVNREGLVPIEAEIVDPLQKALAEQVTA